LYVDDVYLTGDHHENISLLRAAIQTQFSITDLGLLSYSLGLEFHFSSIGILVTQRRYISDMLSEFGLSNCHSVSTSMAEKITLLPDMEAASVDPTHYQRMVGKLIFLTDTRPDIAYSVSVVCRFMEKPQLLYAQALKHIFRYLKVHLTLGSYIGEERKVNSTGSLTPIGLEMRRNEDQPRATYIS
jgi:hypothetical protein